MKIGYLNSIIQRIPIKKACQGYYLRWYYNGWHYWFFLPGNIVQNTEGEQYNTIGTRKIAMGSGQVTAEQVNALRTIRNSREIQMLTVNGWMNLRIEPGTVIVKNNYINGYEFDFIANVGSYEPSVTGFSPVEDIEEIPYGYENIYIVVGGDTITIILIGEGPVTKNWGDGTSDTVILVDGVPHEETHEYSDGEDEHTITIENPDNIDVIDLSDPGNIIIDVIIPIEYSDDIIVVVDPSNFTECFIKIGNQLWDCFNYDSDFPGSLDYNNNIANRDSYGKLYKWDHIISAGFAPPGKHVPTREEWQFVIDIITLAAGGGILKETGVLFWNAPNTGATDAYSFSARGGGYCSAFAVLYFAGLKELGRYWTKTIEGKAKSYIEFLYNSAAMTINTIIPYNELYSVRLLKNFTISETIEDYDGNIYHVIYIGTQKWLLENLKVTHYRDGTPIPNLTVNADWINGSSLTIFNDWFLPSRDELNQMYVNLHLFGVGGFANNTYWSSTENSALSAKAIVFNTGASVNELKSSTHYVRACRSFVAGIGDYSLRDFGPAGGLIFYIDGAGITYYEAAPVDQSTGFVWSNINNIAIGTTSDIIGEGQNNTNEIMAQPGHITSAAKLCDDYSVTRSIIDGAYCWYYNNISFKYPYGALYNWYAVNHTSLLAPAGCHMPTEAEWQTLIAFLATNIGGKLKEAGYDHWLSPNVGATNSSKFTALGASGRSGSSGLFWATLLRTAYFWAATQVDANNAYTKALSYLNDGLGEQVNPKNYGFSVRCIVD